MFWMFLKCVEMCWNLLKYVKICWNMSNVLKCIKCVAICQMCWNVQNVLQYVKCFPLTYWNQFLICERIQKSVTVYSPPLKEGRAAFLKCFFSVRFWYFCVKNWFSYSSTRERACISSSLGGMFRMAPSLPTV